MSEITTLRELRPTPPPAELEAMRMAARERFVSGTRSGRARQRGRVPVVVGGLTATAVGAAAAALVLTSGLGAAPKQQETAGHAGTIVTAAWTVREDADGTVTIDLREYANPAALQRTLHADGIDAIIRAIPFKPLRFGKETEAFRTCIYSLTSAAPAAVQRAAVTFTRPPQTLPVRFIIHPEAMPQGSALFLQFMAGALPGRKNTTFVWAIRPWVLNNATVPACVPRTKAELPNLSVPASKKQ